MEEEEVEAIKDKNQHILADDANEVKDNNEDANIEE